jgi:hypothetical protein
LAENGVDGGVQAARQLNEMMPDRPADTGENPALTLAFRKTIYWR